MAKKLWGGRFTKPADPLAEEFTKSIHYDYKLAECDLVGSMVHVEILKRAGFLMAKEASRLYEGLKSVYESVKKGAFRPDPASEDIHTDIQNKLQDKLGGLALKLHTARSRNDQVVFATKLYSKMAILRLQGLISGLISALTRLAAKNKDVIMPGYTHMQHAQPVYLKDYLGAYIEMLKRDSGKLDYVFSAIKLTMGSGALAGTPIAASHYNISTSRYLKKKLGRGFDIHPPVNSLDTVSDRDFLIDILGCAEAIGAHLSRLSADLLLWSTREFGFVDIDETFCTGSSLMPHKKNADALELIRGYAGRLCGNRVSVLAMIKGLPLTYNRDMQLDKEPLFDSLQIVSFELAIMAALIGSLRFNRDKIEERLEDESLYATDLVYYLVDKGVPFKTAHTIIGRIVKYSQDNNIEIKTMTERELSRFSDHLVGEEIVKLFDPVVSVKSKRSIKRRVA